MKAAQYTDPRAEDYLTKILIERQHKIGSYWFKKVNPLDGFEIEERDGTARLCFSDLLQKYDLDSGDASHYRIRVYDL